MKLPVWPNPKDKSSKLGTERIIALLDKLGNPQNKIPPVFHITGTNGKGSTTAFLKAIFEADGYKVHRYTSPHIIDFNERIEIAGQPITDEYYNELAAEVKKVVEDNNLEISYFEAITAIAILAFSRNHANITILEVGMGGKYDATNVVDSPLASIITPISLDHMKFLGDTVEKIATEKAGIIKSGTPVIISRQTDGVSKVLRDYANKLSCQIYEYNHQWSYQERENSYVFEGIYRVVQTSKPALEGEHQIINAGTAIAAALCQNMVPVSNEAIVKGLETACWIGRLQNITDKYLPLLQKNDNTDFSQLEIWVDGAHNEDGARVLANWLQQKENEDGKKNICIFSILARKDHNAFITNLKQGVKSYFIVDKKTTEEHEFTSVDELTTELAQNNCEVLGVASTADEAITAVAHSHNNARIIICGSLYFIGDVLH